MTTPDPVSPACADPHLDRHDGGASPGRRCRRRSPAGRVMPAVDLRQRGCPAQQRRLGRRAGQVPADAAAEGADQQDGEQAERREPDRQVAQPELRAVPARRRRPGPPGRPRRRPRAAPRPAGRVGSRQGSVGRRPSTRGRWRCAGGPGARRAGPAARWPPGGGRTRAAPPRAAGAAAGAEGGRPVAGEAAATRGPAEGGLLARARRGAAGAAHADAARRTAGAARDDEGALRRARRRRRRSAWAAGPPGDVRGCRAAQGVPSGRRVRRRADGEGADDGRHDGGVLSGTRAARPGRARGGSPSAGRFRPSAATPTPSAAMVPTTPRRSQRAGRAAEAVRGRERHRPGAGASR